MFNSIENPYDAIFEAQKIVFGPFVFQTARVLRDSGILQYLFEYRKMGRSLQEIQETVDLNRYGIKVLLDFAESFNLITRNDGLYTITKVGYFILKDTMTRVNMDFVHDICYKGFFDLDESINEGKPVGLKELGPWSTIYEGLAHLNEKQQKSWFAFDHFYSDKAFPEALPLVFQYKPKRIMDIGGNTGKWSMQCVDYSTDVEMTIVDLPGQLNKALEVVEKKGLQERIFGYQADLLDEGTVLPKVFDFVWMSQFLDCFSEPEILSILEKAKGAIDQDGHICILETYCDRQPNQAAEYCINATSLYFTCIANGNSRMYHADDMYSMVEKAGLQVVEEHDEVGGFHTLLFCKKR